MSLIVDVLKMAQRERVAKAALPQFIKYPYDEGVRLKAFISKNTWLFGMAIGLSVVLILVVFGMGSQGRKPRPEPDVSHKIVAPAEEFLAHPSEAHFSEDKPASVQIKKAETQKPEKRKTPAFSEGKKVDSGNQLIPSGKTLMEKRPSDAIRDRFELAVSYQKQGETMKAVEEYRKVIAIDPMNVEAHNNLGVLYKDMGKLNQAVSELRLVLSMDPQQEKARNNLGIILYLKGNLAEAIQEFRGILDVNPSNREACINLGVIYKRQNRIGKAKRMFEEALSIDRYSPEAYYNLGLISEESGDLKEATSYYQKFIDFAGSSYHELTAKVKRHLEILSASER